MSRIKQEYSPYVLNAVKQIDEQISHYQQLIKTLQFHRKMWLEHNPDPVNLPLSYLPLTRDTIRNFFKMYSQPMQTVSIINMLYHNKTDEEKSKLVKTLSVILNQMEKEGEILIERKKGIKGNFYQLKENILE